MYIPPGTCARCRTVPAAVTVVDDHGSHRLCSLCVVQVLAENEARGDLTVFVSRPAVTA